MAKVRIDLPRDWEADIEKNEDGSITLVPRFRGTSRTATCCYITTIGAGGMERKSVIKLNGRNGWVTSMKLGGEKSSECDFDLPEDEYTKLRASEGDDGTEPPEDDEE